MVLGDEWPIGQTALEKLDLFVDCVNQRLVRIRHILISLYRRSNSGPEESL